MSIKSIKATVGDKDWFFGGAAALNLLGSVTKSGGIPETWKKKINEFLGCEDGNTLKLGGHDIVKNGLYVSVKGIEFTMNTGHGEKGPAYWEIADKLSDKDPIALAQTVRSVLGAPAAAKCDAWEATLTAAMFLSEVVRNPRSFVVNLMLLDLIEGKVVYGRSETKTLDFSKLLKFGGTNKQKAATYTYGDAKGETRSVAVGKNAAEGTVRGGKLPMSHLNAMKQYGESIGLSGPGERKYKYDAYAKQSALNLVAPDQANAAYHFQNELLDKECTVLLRWLLAYFGKNPLSVITGYNEQQRTVQNAWTKAAATTVVQTAIRANVTLTGLREHVRDAAWTDVSAADCGKAGPAGTLCHACKQAIESRQSQVAKLL